MNIKMQKLDHKLVGQYVTMGINIILCVVRIRAGLEYWDIWIGIR